MSGRARALVIAAAVVHLALCALPDTMGDVLEYRLWARALARDGLAEAYWPSQPLVASAERLDRPIDYPPVFPYLLLVVGRVAAFLSLSDAQLDTLVRVPAALAGIAIGLLLLSDVRPRAGVAAATTVAVLYLLNPAVLFDTAYWGQADALSGLFVVASVVALGRNRPEWAWAGFALAVLTKPLAYPFAPLLLLVTAKRWGWARTVRCAVVSCACAAVVVVPFLFIGRLGRLLRSLFFQLDAMPYASVNAHNLWWLVQRGAPWVGAREKAFGIVSYEALGLALLAAFFLATLARLWKSESEAGVRLAFASAAFGFFVLATHMHENHLFLAIPLLLLAGLELPRVRRGYALLSLLFLANMALHDPYLTHVFRPWGGARLLLPPEPRVDPAFFEYFLAHGYTGLVEQMRGESSVLGVLLGMLNAQAVVLAFGWWLWSFYRGPSFDVAFERSEARLRWPWALAAGAVFVVGTGVPFVSRAMREDRLRVTADLRWVSVSACGNGLPADPGSRRS